MTRRHLKYTEKKYVETLLSKHIEVIEPGLCRYLDNASDASMAAEARMANIDGCTPHNIAGVRDEVFGSLKKRPEGERMGAIEEQCEKLKDRLRKTESDLVLVMDYLTRTAGVSWTLEQYTNQKVQAAKDHLNGKPAQ